MGTDYEREITCPYCQHKFSDSWEYNEDNGRNIDCHHCDETFALEVDIAVTYSTARLDCIEGGKEHIYTVPIRRDRSQATCDGYNAENFLGKVWTPITRWVRACNNCEHEQRQEVPLDEKCPEFTE
jgi:uncharacterized Zn-finger protein